MEYLKEVKLRLNIKGKNKDELLLSYIKQAEEKIKGYCNIKVIPKDLYFTVVALSVDLYEFTSQDGRKESEEKQGNRSVKYKGKSDVDIIVGSYTRELNRYRRIKVF